VSLLDDTPLELVGLDVRLGIKRECDGKRQTLSTRYEGT